MKTVKQVWGLCCPKCGSDEDLEITIQCEGTLKPDGVDTNGTVYHGKQDWHNESSCSCMLCKRNGTVADFFIGQQVTGKWELRKQPPPGSTLRTEHEDWDAYTICEDGIILARVCKGQRAIEAASLMYAAPEMLAALESALVTMQAFGEVQSQPERETIAQIKTAIEAARIRL